MNFVELLLGKAALEGRLHGNGIDVRKHLFDDIVVEGVEAETIPKDEATRIIFAGGFADDSEVFASNEAKEGLVAGRNISTFPFAEEVLISLLTGRVRGQVADEFDPIRIGGVLEGP